MAFRGWNALVIVLLVLHNAAEGGRHFEQQAVVVTGHSNSIEGMLEPASSDEENTVTILAPDADEEHDAAPSEAPTSPAHVDPESGTRSETVPFPREFSMQCDLIMDALSEAEAAWLGHHTTNLVKGMVVESLVTPKDKRHAYQNAAVTMIDETIFKIEFVKDQEAAEAAFNIVKEAQDARALREAEFNEETVKLKADIIALGVKKSDALKARDEAAATVDTLHAEQRPKVDALAKAQRELTEKVEAHRAFQFLQEHSSKTDKGRASVSIIKDIAAKYQCDDSLLGMVILGHTFQYDKEKRDSRKLEPVIEGELDTCLQKGGAGSQSTVDAAQAQVDEGAEKIKATEKERDDLYQLFLDAKDSIKRKEDERATAKQNRYQAHMEQEQHQPEVDSANSHYVHMTARMERGLNAQKVFQLLKEQ